MIVWKKAVIRKAAALAAVTAVLVSALAGCAEITESGAEKTTEEERWAEDVNAILPEGGTTAMQTQTFDEKLMSFLSKKAEGNYMASPLSFRYALGLLLAGANGETKTELLKALSVESEQEWIEEILHFNGFVKSYEKYFEAALQEFDEYKKDGYVDQDAEPPFMALRVANSVWKNEKISAPFTDAYQESVTKNYAAEYRSFTPENAVSKINEWASVKTEKLIEELLPPGFDTANLAVVLMNALYFKDSWVNTFDAYRTGEGDFTTASGETVKKEFMNQQDHFYYYKDDVTELVVLPMKGGVSMAFVLGDTKGVAEKIYQADYRRVIVSIPKIDLETSFNQGEFVEFLKENGVNLAFDAEKADFSDMIDANVFVSDIIQKTRIKLDEDGVEAAAVTAIAMCGASYDPDEPAVFTADRPFSFYIFANPDNVMETMFAGEIVE